MGVYRVGTAVTVERYKLERDLKHLAYLQKRTGNLMREKVFEAHADGMSWAAIAKVLGMQTPTLWRQCKAGSPVVVVRPFHGKEVE